MNDLVTQPNVMDVNISGMPLGLAVMFNDKLYERCKELARIMAAGEGFTPPHLLKKQEACFAVVTRALTWKLDPQAVASCTYQTPGGRIGYEGKLIQAILENSGKLVGPVRYEFYGEWAKIKGKFEIRKSERDKNYAVPTWTRKDAEGLGVTVRALVRGEVEERTWDADLDEMFPLNSTLWATRPKQQICYTACRAFANLAAPGLLMGVPFDVDPDADSEMVDVTPKRPMRSAFDSPAEDVKTESAKSVPADGKAGEESGEHTAPGAASPADSQDNPVPEFSAADAYELGREHFRQKKALMAVPGEWRDGKHDDWVEARASGWRAEEAEANKKK